MIKHIQNKSIHWKDEPAYSFYSTMIDKTPSKSINWNELTELAGSPLQVEKSQAPLIVPYLANGKTKEYAEKAYYNAIAIDFDGVPYSLEGAVKRISELYSGTFLYFTTASHKQEGKGNRFKMIIPLEKKLTSEGYKKLSTGIALFCKTDQSQARITQGFYSPNTRDISTYQSGIIDGDKSRLNDKSELFIRAMKRYTDEKANAQQTAKLEPYRPKKILSNESVIQKIKQTYTLEELLQAHGYRRQGRVWIAPNSTSGIAGVHITDDRVYSHHENDPLGATHNGGHSLDVADVLAILDYNGDFKAMIRDQANRLQMNVSRQISYQHTRNRSGYC